MSNQELIDALRCISRAGGPVGDCKKCPFLRTEHIGSDLAKMAGKDEWESCDVDGVAIAAADRLANQNTHILALQKEIEGLRAKLPRWIPVTERLPETEPWGASKVVLGIVQNETGYPPPNPCFCVYLGNQQWTLRGRLATISHWMPLPESPKEVEA